MIYCGNCGKEVTDNSGICKQCGEPVPRLDGAQIHDTNESEYNSSSSEYSEKTNKSQLISFKIISFLFPIVGLILFFCYRKTESEKAISCLRFAGFGFLTNILFSIAFTLLIPFIIIA